MHEHSVKIGIEPFEHVALELGLILLFHQNVAQAAQGHGRPDPLPVRFEYGQNLPGEALAAKREHLDQNDIRIHGMKEVKQQRLALTPGAFEVPVFIHGLDRQESAVHFQRGHGVVADVVRQ